MPTSPRSPATASSRCAAHCSTSTRWGASSPVRIDLFDDRIDSIRIFDPETQRSTGQFGAPAPAAGARIPARCAGGARVSRPLSGPLRRRPEPLGSCIARSAMASRRRVSSITCPCSIDAARVAVRLPARAARCSSIPPTRARARDCCGTKSSSATSSGATTLNARARSARDLPAARRAPGPGRCDASHRGVAAQGCRRMAAADTELSVAAATHAAAQPARRRIRAPRFRAFLHGFAGRALLAAESAGRREILLELLRGRGIEATQFEDWHAFTGRHGARRPHRLTLSRRTAPRRPAAGAHHRRADLR